MNSTKRFCSRNNNFPETRPVKQFSQAKRIVFGVCNKHFYPLILVKFNKINCLNFPSFKNLKTYYKCLRCIENFTIWFNQIWLWHFYMKFSFFFFSFFSSHTYRNCFVRLCISINLNKLTNHNNIFLLAHFYICHKIFVFIAENIYVWLRKILLLRKNCHNILFGF